MKRNVIQHPDHRTHNKKHSGSKPDQQPNDGRNCMKNVGEFIEKGNDGCVFEWCGEEDGLVAKIIHHGTTSSESEVLMKITPTQPTRIVHLERAFRNNDGNHVLLFKKGDWDLYTFFVAQCDMTMGRCVVRDIVVDVLTGLTELHQLSIYHADVKLENIIMFGKIAKIVDFGAAQFVESDVTAGDIGGTLAYMSPEMIKGDTIIGTPTDIWSMGVMMFVMLTGVFPFGPTNCATGILDGDTVQSVKSHILAGLHSINRFKDLCVQDKEAADLIGQMMDANPKNRPSAIECLRHPFCDQSSFPRK
jgi:serine/threonine protein kinase